MQIGEKMKILAIDSSGLVASVAVVTEEDVIAEYTFNYKKTHSLTLMPMIEELVERLELDLSEIDAIAAAAGPGSFTGLRIGASTAKGLAFALKKPIIGVSTVEALGYNLYHTDGLICPIMDARRDQVYTGVYEFAGEEYRTVIEEEAVELTTLAEQLNKLGKSVIFLGDGVAVYKEKLAELLEVPYSYAPIHLSKQRAGSVGALGMTYYKKGKYVDGKDFEPIYLRLSQAERERNERGE